MADWKVDGKPVDTSTTQPSSSGGWKVDGKDVAAPSGIMNAQMKPSTFAEAQAKSPLWQGIRSARGFQTILDATGHPYVAKGVENLTDAAEYGLKKITGAGAAVGQAVFGGMNALTRYAPKGSLFDQTVGQSVRHGLAGSVGGGESSPEAESARNLTEFALPFIAPELPGAKLSKTFQALEGAAKTGGVIKRPLAAATRDAVKVFPLVHAQTGGDFSRSLPAAGLAGLAGGIFGGLGALYDKFAGMTQDIHPERIEASNFAKNNTYGPVDPKTGQPTTQPVTVDPATRTGSPMMKNTKKALSSGVNAPKAESLENLQSDEYAALGERMGEHFGGGNPAMEPIQTGQSNFSALDQVREGHRQAAKSAYDGAEAFERFLPTQRLPVVTYQDVPTGQTSQLTGQPIVASRPVTVTKSFKVPTDRTQLQQQLKPLLDNAGTIDQAKKMANPALAMIHDIVYGDSVVESSRALQDLSALYQVAKLDKGQYSGTINNFLASKTMQAYRQTVDQSIAAVNPHLLDLINEGRTASGKQHAIETLINRIGGKIDPKTPYSPSSLSPVDFYQGLVRRKDTAFPLLQQFAAEAPGEVPHVASTLFQGILEAAGKGDKSFTSARTARTLWNNVGNQTKELLFPGKVQDIDNFFRLGEYLAQNPQPSNTGMHLLMTARLTSLLTNTGLFAKDTAIEYVLGKYMFSNSGALPYMRQITPGVFRINPAAAGAAAIFHRITGIDPAVYGGQPRGKRPVQQQQQQPVVQ